MCVCVRERQIERKGWTQRTMSPYVSEVKMCQENLRKRPVINGTFMDTINVDLLLWRKERGGEIVGPCLPKPDVPEWLCFKAESEIEIV